MNQINKVTQKTGSMLLWRKVVLLSMLMCIYSSTMAQMVHNHSEHDNRTDVAVMNLSYGHITFTNTTVTYKATNGGALQTHTRQAGDVYHIKSNTAATPYTIRVGTESTPVSVNTVIYLEGINITPNHGDITNHRPSIYVNTSADTVTFVLKNGTNNLVRGYSCANGTHKYAHAAIEKEINTQGTLRITCETGYASANRSHDCPNSTCGQLLARAWGYDLDNNPEGSSADSSTWYLGPAIGAKGYLGSNIDHSGTESASGTLYNLVISGGRITARGAKGPENSRANGAAAIGTGASGGPKISSSVGYNIENLRVEGGRIKAYAGEGRAACVGGGYHSGYVTMWITGGRIDATEKLFCEANTGPAVGGGGGGSSTSSYFGATVNITGGTILANSQYGAAIGAGAGGANGNGTEGIVNISGSPTIVAYSSGYGAGIGTGGSMGKGHSGHATVTISGNPNIEAYSALGADIGGGGTNSSDPEAYGGHGTVSISGGTITTTGGGIGGGVAKAGTGGDAHITISGTANVTSPSIGGGSSETGKGGDATVLVTGGTMNVSSIIGGGNSISEETTANGGNADVTVSGGTLTIAGKIGGGKSYGTGNGGNASIHVTGGLLDCASIGGGDSNLGLPGAVAHDPDPETGDPIAGVRIEGGTLKSGYIGGGANTAGDVGKATAYITGGNIQGQFILCNNTSTTTDHCYFTMTGGTIDNTNLGAIGATSYPRLKPQGGAVYMEDNNAEVSISGGTIQNCRATQGGAVFMSAGTFTLSGTGVIKNNRGYYSSSYPSYGTTVSTENGRGGGVFMYGGTFNMNGGTIGGESLVEGNKAENYGGGIFLRGGHFTMNDGSLAYNEAENYRGGGVYIAEPGYATIQGGNVIGNKAADIGGGLFINTRDATYTTRINSSQSATLISGNQATHGAGIYINRGTVEVSEPANTLNVYGNVASGNGGGFFLNDGTFNLNGGTIGGTAANTDMNTATNYGGGIFINIGTFNMNGGDLQYNKTLTYDGGGVYIADGGKANIYGGNITGNIATRNGGGFYVNPGSGNTTNINSNSGNTLISGNKAKNGGGAYIASGELSVASTNGNTTSICNNTATVNGGGFYAGSDVEVVSGTICDNSAVNGAGFYSASGSVQVTSNSSISGNTATANGGGIYAAGGNVAVNPGNVSVEVLSDNHADNGNGGAIYAGGGNVHFEGGTITGNSANNGGAIYANGGTVTFRDGVISSNHALARGGGLYITESGNLALQGTAKLTRNHVPSAGEGGGVYLAGVVYVGSEGGTSTSPKPDAIIAEDNFADDDPDAEITYNNRNNIFLPKPRVNSGHKDVITIYPYGMSLNSGSGTHTHVGFSVPRNFVPVIYCANWQYLRDNKSALVASVFDDSELYYTVWNSELPYNKNYIYLSGLLWTEAVYQWPMTGCPASGFEVDADGNVTIRTKEGFAWLISYVNGRTDDYPFEPHDMAGKKVTIDLAEGENLDMHQYGWVPIGYGETGKEFKGEFEGNGNSISGIIVTYGNDQGVFGDVTGSAKISNVFISNTALSSMRYDVGTYYMGGLACKVGDNAEVFGCGANGPINCLDLATGVVMGGLVGKLYGNAKIHSCYATPEMEGYTMGGLIGEMDGGTVENCFSYPKFVAYDASTAYIGGLTAKMTDGRFENCYTHELSGSSHGAGGKFGWFAGDYEAGVFNYCYAPENANYVHTGTLGAASGEGYGWFAPTALVDGKYGFKHRDQDVTKAIGAHTNDFIENGIVDENGNLKGLLATLNNWVAAQGTDTQYSSWMRTMASHVNLDLPVLEYKGEACLGSETGAITYSKDVNDLLGDFLDGDIYLYGTNPKQVSKSTKTNVRLYIKPNVGILQTASASLNARVGVLLDNSKGDAELGGLPYDWHMFSTPLNNAPLGLTYNPNGVSYTPAYGIDPPQVAIGSGCYFPTNTPYGAPYTSDGSFDYYCYSEPDYHWINFKRSSNDHWQQNEPHDYIDYNDINNQGTAGNEATLIPGKGYMLAVSYPTMVMADGRLNNGTVTYKATNSDLHGYEAPLKGVNLIGNPYQSYLDFDKFVNGNTGISGNTYYILDADSSKYLAYTAGSTDNGIGAPGYLHPHQGFFVRVETNQTLEFTNAMRSVEGNADTHFRGERPAYPLVNMVCTDAKGMMDYATIELNRPEQGGGQKIGGLRTGDASVWFHLDGEDWQTAFTREGLQTAPLRFEAHADGTYTMRWNTLNGDFSYLHLVDNMTGTDTDCLLTEEYRFTATTSDYTSRFRLVFDFTGVEENDEPTEGPATFAFMMGDELVINGEGVLQMFDLNGRQLLSTEIHGTQATVAMPKVADGLYVLRLTNGNQVRTQKMVINK